MTPHECSRERGLNHLRWCARYWFGFYACLFAAGFALPRSGLRALFAFACAYGFYALAARERRLARGLLT